MNNEIHSYEEDDYLLIVNGEVLAVSGNSDFYEVVPKVIPEHAKVTCVKVVRHGDRG